MRREAHLEAAFKRRVEQAGGQVRKLVTPGRRHAPDRLVLWPGTVGHVDFVELKALGKKPRAGQDREHNRLRSWGFNVYVIDRLDLVDVYLAIKRNNLCK